MLLLLQITHVAIEASDTSSLSLDETAELSVVLEATDDAQLALDETSDVQQASAAQEAFTGGFFMHFERHATRRDREREEREAAIEATKALEAEVDREIAQFLHEQQAQEAQRKELDRLSTLVAQFADRQAELAFNERVAKAYARALAQQNASALLALERELGRQLEDEEFAVLMALALDD